MSETPNFKPDKTVEFEGSPSRKAELRANFVKFYTYPPDQFGSPQPVFQFELDDNSKIKLPQGNTLVDEVERWRKRVIHPFRLRGTAGHFMEQARQKNVFSAKKVDYPDESDVGSIATYRAAPGDRRVSSDQFLYLLESTTIAALKYAMTHGNWMAFSNQEIPIEESLKMGKHLLTMEPPIPKFKMSDSLEIAACHETPQLHSDKIIRIEGMKNEIEQQGRTSLGGGGSIFEPNSRESIDFWNKSLAPFKEDSFRPKNPVQDYSPVYVSVGKQDVLNIIDQLQNPESPERKFIEEMTARAGLKQTPLKDAILLLLGEKTTLKLLDALQAWNHDNEDSFQYAG